MKKYELNFLFIFVVLMVMAGMAVSDGEEGGAPAGGETQPGDCTSDEQCDSVCQTEDPPQKGSCLDHDCICLPQDMEMPQDVIDDEMKNGQLSKEENEREDEEEQTDPYGAANEEADDGDEEEQDNDEAAEESA